MMNSFLFLLICCINIVPRNEMFTLTAMFNVSTFIGQLDCKDCPPGYYCLEGAREPVACPKGTFNSLSSRGSLAECRSCISGMACPRPGLTWPPVKCDAGYYCPAGSSLPNETIHACPAGTYTDYHNLTHARECTQCPERQSCEAGTGGIQKPPQECAKGMEYCMVKIVYRPTLLMEIFPHFGNNKSSNGVRVDICYQYQRYCQSF